MSSSRRSSSPTRRLLADSRVHFKSPEKRPRPLVHYSDDVHDGKPRRPDYHRAASSDTLSPRPPSLAGTDDDSDEYDWSGEDDLVDEEAKFDKNMGLNLDLPHRHRWGVRRILAGLFSSLIGSTLIAGMLVTAGVLVDTLWYEPHKTEYRLYVKDNVQCWLFWLASNLVISWYLAVLVDLVPTAVRFLLAGFWGHISESVKTRLELYVNVKNTLKPALYAASAWVSWIIIFVDIYALYDMGNPSESASYLYRVYQVIQFIFFLALVICAQKMLLHAIAFAFHRTAYKERVHTVKEALAVIERLRQYRPKPPTPRKPGSRTPVHGDPSPMSDKEHYGFLHSALRNVMMPEGRRRRSSTIDDMTEADADAESTAKRKGKARMSDTGHMTSGGSSPESHHATPPTVSSQHHYPPTSGGEGTTGDGSPTIIHAAKVLKQAVLHDARNLRRGTSVTAGSSWTISSPKEAKRLARAIYTRLSQRHRHYLIPSDFYPAFHDQASAEAAFRVFDNDNNGDISRAEIKTTIMKVYKERRFLARSMRDVGQALRTLNHILLFFAFVVLFFISLSVFGVDISKSLTSIYSLFIAASFIFKTSSASAFDSMMFLFVTHPFDTGDRCLIDTDNLVVKKVGLFATVFSNSNGSETYYFNSLLFTKFITNYRRSGKTFENLTMQVAWKTPMEKLDELQRCLNEWLSTEENRWFEPSTSIVLQQFVYQRYLEITISIGHNGNWQDWSLRSERKTAFNMAVHYYCRQLGIVFHETPLPIAITDEHGRSPSPSVHSEDNISVPVPDSDEATVPSVEQKIREPDFTKPILGFRPPASARTSGLKARKSKSRKAALRAAT
ncbi:Mechanosensitive ion channel-domain-containing protein [Amanita rubescens]|nr:Mechanosensitive ion channel-domain-containing protein [Amanita rubescens]